MQIFIKFVADKTLTVDLKVTIDEVQSRIQDKVGIHLSADALSNALEMALLHREKQEEMALLRREKQEEWDRRELAQLKEEEFNQKKKMDSMISKEIYRRDMDQVKAQHDQMLQDVRRERNAERVKHDGEKKKLEDDMSKLKADLKATTEGVIETEAVEEGAGR